MSNLEVGGTKQKIGQAKNNTLRLYAVMGDTVYTKKDGSETTDNYAAKAALEYSIDVDGVTYDEWYLPTDYEVIKMRENLRAKGIGNLRKSWYWTSLEGHEEAANRIDLFYSYTYEASLDKSYKAYVRPIRYFI